MNNAQKMLLERALRGLKKPELIAEVMELAKSIPGCWNALESRLNLQAETVEDLVARAQVAISQATDYDDRDANNNFAYDYDAYEKIKRYFKQLVKLDQLDIAMDLAETLMRDGTEQVEMSDEGLMWDDIEECLDVVFNAVEKSSMTDVQAAAWAARLEQADRVGVYRHLNEFWAKPRPRETWSQLADHLIQLLPAASVREHSSDWYRRERLLRRIEHVLKAAGRGEEVASLRSPPSKAASGSANHRSSRRR